MTDRRRGNPEPDEEPIRFEIGIRSASGNERSSEGYHQHVEGGSRVDDVTFSGDGDLRASVAGHLVFARRRRHLVMLDEPFVQLRPHRRVRRAFTATLRQAGTTFILESIQIAPDPDPAPDWLWADESDNEPPYPDGIDSAIMRATRPEAIVAMTLRTILGHQDYFARLLAFDAERPSEERVFSDLLGHEAELRDALVRLETGTSSPPVARGGRKPYADDHYRDVARLCLALFADGRRTGIHHEIAAYYHRDPRTVADWIRKARHLGWLAPGEPGRVSFRPGPRLLKGEGNG